VRVLVLGCHRRYVGLLAIVAEGPPAYAHKVCILLASIESTKYRVSKREGESESAVVLSRGK